jgi:hypothetical protein
MTARPDPRQFDLLALLAPVPAPAIIRPCDADGAVVRGEVDETLTLPHPRMAWHSARIELHRHDDGLWMWSTSWQDDDGSGATYRVGPKWGKFAATRDDALAHASGELQARARGKVAARIRKWLGSLAA